MKELLSRVFSNPLIASELVIASFFVNLLALVSPIFVMQVLNRYVSQGVDATLITLTSGALIAAVLEFAFRQARSNVARGVSVLPDETLAIKGFATLARAKTAALEQIPPETRREMVSGSQAIETAYNATNIATILDVPFALMFVGVLYLMNPIISMVVATFLIAVFAVGVYGGLSLRDKTAESQNASGVGGTLLSTLTRESDTVRAFNATGFLLDAWREHTYHAQGLRRDIGSRQGMVQSITQSSTGLMSIAVVTVGATLVVLGEMDVGAMMGANILSARALQPISKFSQLGATFAKARQSMELFAKLSTVPLEHDSGSALSEYSGHVEFRDVAMAFQGSPTPLFESLNLDLKPGQVLVVTGANGTGKTTLAKLLMGLLEPARGQILVDGLDLKQVAPEWWRRQVIHLPQEPALLNATIEENLRVNAPDIELSELNRIIDAAGLRRFVDESPQGFETPVLDNGWRLSEGIRRRMALARALTTNGRLAIIDEPTESLDAEGCAAVHGILGQLAQTGVTIIVLSHDRNIVKGPHMVLDLNVKPVPEVVEVAATPKTVEAEAVG